MMIIRKMTIDDYSAVYQLWLSCKGLGLNSIDDSKEGIHRFLQRNPDTCFVAIEDGNMVGVILAGNDGRRGYLYHTATAPRYRNQGIAGKLVKTATEALSALGITKVALVVFENNERGNSFWETQGFTPRQDLIYRNKALTEAERMDT